MNDKKETLVLSVNDPVMRLFRIRRSELCYATFILESYEGLCTFSTVDRREGIISITATAGLAAEADLLLVHLARETGMTEVFPESPIPAGDTTCSTK